MTRYEFRVKSKPALDWADWFRELQVSTPVEEGPQPHEVLLTGVLPDQSALLGVLMRLHNLNLTILSVLRLDAAEGRELSGLDES